MQKIFYLLLQNWSLLLGFRVTDKPYFESSHKNRCTQISVFKTRILLKKTKSVVAYVHE